LILKKIKYINDQQINIYRYILKIKIKIKTKGGKGER
jgi:hypothetical protein